MSLIAVTGGAVEELWVHKGRTLLTVVGIVVATAALTVVNAAGQIAAESSTIYLEQHFGRAATMQVMVTAESKADQPLASSWFETRLERYSIEAFSRYRTVETTAKAGGVTHKVELIGVDPAIASVRRLDVAGRWLEERDGRVLMPVLVETGSEQKATNLSLTAGTGDTVTARSVGTVRSAASTDMSTAYLHIDALDRWWPSGEGGAETFLLRLPPNLVQPFSEAIARDASTRGGVSVELARLDPGSVFSGVIAQQRTVLQLIAAVALLTGMLGLANVNLATVKTRSREFAVRRALGAPRRDVFLLVVLESVLLSVVAGAAGVLVAMFITRRLPELITGSLPAIDRVPFPVDSMVLGLAVATAVGLAASAVPAIRAVRLPIADAIR